MKTKWNNCNTKPLEFSTVPLFTMRNLMVILEIAWFEFLDTYINTFHLILFLVQFTT